MAIEIYLAEDKIKRIETVLHNSEFKTMDEFIDRAVELLLFAEENKNQFAKFLGKE